MITQPKVTDKEKKKIISECKSNKNKIEEYSKEYSIPKIVIEKWIEDDDPYGLESIQSIPEKKKSWFKDFKLSFLEKIQEFISKISPRWLFTIILGITLIIFMLISFKTFKVIDRSSTNLPIEIYSKGIDSLATNCDRTIQLLKQHSEENNQIINTLDAEQKVIKRISNKISNLKPPKSIIFTKDSTSTINRDSISFIYQ